MDEAEADAMQRPSEGVVAEPEPTEGTHAVKVMKCAASAQAYA